MASDLVAEKSRAKQKSSGKKARVPAKPITLRYLEDPLPNEDPVVPNPQSTDYRTISEKIVYEEVYHNAKIRKSLREVTVSGVKLVWDRQKWDPALRNLSDKKDISRIMIFADSVHINMPLRFPQSEVVIFARQLVFGSSGSIEITPDSKPGRPSKKELTAGRGDYRGIDGIDGKPAGSILLSVNTLCIPDEDKSKPTVRIFACGARGQDGGDVILKNPKPKKKAPVPVTWQRVRDKVFKTLFCTIPYAIPTTLEMEQWPARLGAKIGRKKTFEDDFTDTWKPKFESNHVLYVEANVDNPLLRYYIHNWRFTLGDDTNIPDNGYNAYPAGNPGKGGAGGTVMFLGKLAFYSESPKDDELIISELNKPGKITFDKIVDASGGEAGTSNKMEGTRPPALWEKKACHVKMHISFNRGVRPTDFKIKEDVTPKMGNPANPPTAENGSMGQVIKRGDEPTPFIHEHNTEAMLSYAKDACMAHNRKLAEQVVKVYLDAIDNVREEDKRPRLQALRAELDTLKQQLNSDVDIYGNQRGWVPYLSVVANKDIFDATARSAFDSMYLCTKMKDRYKTMADNLNCLTATRNQCEQIFVKAQKALEDAQNDYLGMQDGFDDINARINTLQDEVVGLNEEIEGLAKLDEKNKAVYAGIAKTVGGAVQLLGVAIQCFPAGEPATGIVGGAFELAGGAGGNFVSSLIEGRDFFDAGGELTDNAFDYLDKNKKKIVNTFAKAKSEQENKDIKAAKAEYDEVGKETRALTREKNLLIDLTKIKEPEAEKDEDFDKFKIILEERSKDTLELIELRQHKEDLAIRAEELEKGPSESLDERLYQAIKSNLEKVKKDIKDQEEKIKKKDKERDKTIEELALTSKPIEFQNTIHKLLENSEKADAAADRIAILSKKIQKKAETTQDFFDNVAKLKGGFQQGLDGVRKLCVRREDLEPKIQADIEKLKGTIFYTQRFKDLSQKITVLNNDKEKFIRQFERCQITIDSATSAITSSMGEMDAIDDRTLGISGALDHSVFSALVSLDNEARAMLMEQLYYFAKSYEYRTLKKVSPEFYKLDKFMVKLRGFLGIDKSSKEFALTKSKKDEEGNVVKKGQFDDMYKLLNVRLRELVKPLIADLERGHLAEKTTHRIPVHDLIPPQTFKKLNTLREDGSYEPILFNLVKCGISEPTTRKNRIVSLNLENMVLANPEKAKQKRTGFQIEFKHSGVSKLYDGKEHFLFRSQTDDEIISWNFTCNVNQDGGCDIKPVEIDLRDIKLIKELLNGLCDKNQKDVDQLSAPYRPGASSDITLTRKKKGIIPERAEIADFDIVVELEGIM